MEAFGRLTLFPVLWTIYSVLFASTMSMLVIGIIWSLVSIFVISVFIQEYKHFVVALPTVFEDIEKEKISRAFRSTDNKLTWRETLAFNIWKMGTFSFKLRTHFRQNSTNLADIANNDIRNSNDGEVEMTVPEYVSKPNPLLGIHKL